MVDYLTISLWETVQNIAPWMGFLLATFIARKEKRLLTPAVILVVSMFTGALLISITEVQIGQLIGQSYQFSWRDVAVNTLIFTVVAFPMLLYFHADDKPWSGYLTDVGLGVLIGVGVAIGQYSGGVMVNQVFTGVMHAIALSAGFCFTLVAMRYLIKQEGWLPALVGGVAITIVASMVIVAIDYTHFLV